MFRREEPRIYQV
jgi:hypothetical protein